MTDLTFDPSRQLDDALLLTANLIWFDSLIRHQIHLLRVSGSVRNEVIAILNATEAEVNALILTRLGGGVVRPSRSVIRSVRALMRDIEAVRHTAFIEASSVWSRSLSEVAKIEAGFVSSALTTSLPVQVSPSIPKSALLKNITTARPFEGRVMSDWAKSIESSDLRRIRDAITIGMVQGETGPQIARRVVGSSLGRGRNGVTQITRRNAESITRTAIMHITGQVRKEFALMNQDIFSSEIYVATLDSRTTPICRSLDGKVFDIGVGFYPPVHFACRSLRVPFIDEGLIGTRPFKISTEKMLLREYGEVSGVGLVKSRSRLPRGHKGRFDAFSRSRMGSLVGQLPAKTTYAEFLARQSRGFQDEVLGMTRARLFRAGGMTLDRFVDRAGREISLSVLARTDADAFRAAGLKPTDFLAAA